MTAAHANIHDREVIFNMSYFGVLNCMFVHFNLHTTHEAVCDSLLDLILSESLLYDILKCMATLQYHLFQYTKTYSLINVHIACI